AIDGRIQHSADTNSANGKSQQRTVPVFCSFLGNIAIEQRQDEPEVGVFTDDGIRSRQARGQDAPELFRLAQDGTGGRVCSKIKAKQLLMPGEGLDIVDRVVFGPITRGYQRRARPELANT